MHNSRFAVVILTATLISLAAVWVHADLTEDAIQTDEGKLTIHPLNHATFVITWDKKTIYVDPVGGAEAFGAFDQPDIILITHIHGDHTSADTVKATASDSTVILAPATVSEKLGERVSGHLTILANSENFEIEGITIDAVPAYNLTEDRKSFHPKGRDNGYVVSMGGKRLYIAGDTEDIPEMRALSEIDAAFVCMNLPYTMTVDRAADAVLEFKPKIVYPYHYRGKSGMSDLEEFSKLVAAEPGIEVRLLKWY